MVAPDRVRVDEGFPPPGAAPRWQAMVTPPHAAKKPHAYSHHGIDITDDYAWLRDPGYPEVSDKEVLAHLEAENAWFESRMARRHAAFEPGVLGLQVREDLLVGDLRIPGIA